MFSSMVKLSSIPNSYNQLAKPFIACTIVILIYCICIHAARNMHSVAIGHAKHHHVLGPTNTCMGVTS